MNIQHLSSGSARTHAAGQKPLHARAHLFGAAKKPEAKPAEAVKAEQSEPAKAVSTEPTTAVPSTQSPKVGVSAATAAPAAPADLKQRLANYVNNIDKRLDIALSSPKNTPEQKAELEKAKEQFHGLMQRLEGAFSAGGRPQNVMTIGEGRDIVLGHLAGMVDKVAAGGKIDVTG